MPRFPSAQGRLNHEPDSTLAVTNTCPKDGVHLYLLNPIFANRRPNHDARQFFLFTSANVSTLSLSRPFRISSSLHRSHHIVLLSVIR